jgi:hypothetical protein
MKIKEPFLLCFSLLLVAASFLPGELRRRNGKPYENQMRTRVACFAIGVALVVLWYSLPRR